mgnify:CR=1 FL=1
MAKVSTLPNGEMMESPETEKRHKAKALLIVPVKSQKQSLKALAPATPARKLLKSVLRHSTGNISTF